ncbi:MAG: hypothetical protein A2033_09360 [Bacteroidetes bacterium GWA2_31_9]|nr:MAG: hypothetical protein A2033_09360 [Bacteroidetes bacterium GWA2_31_9]
MKKIIFLLLLFTTTLISCEDKEVQIGDIEGVKVVEMTKSKVTLELMIPINNPNNTKFKVTNIDLDINLNGTDLGKVKELKNIKIPANSNETHSFLVEVEFSKILAGGLNILGSLMNKGKTKVKLKGKIHVKSFMLGKTIDVNIDKPIKMLDLGNFKL